MQLSSKSKIRRLVGGTLIGTFAMAGAFVGPAGANVPQDEDGLPTPPGGPAPIPSMPQIPPGEEGRPPDAAQIPVPVPVPGGGG